ncbi:(2Fe-2S)-binding protein [Streptomyces erythrochromogenes]
MEPLARWPWAATLPPTRSSSTPATCCLHYRLAGGPSPRDRERTPDPHP